MKGGVKRECIYEKEMDINVQYVEVKKIWLYIISNIILIKMGGNFGRGNIMISILLHYVVLATKEDMQNLIFQLKQ